MSDQKKLDEGRYLQALGLFTMARMHSERSNAFRDELQRLLDIEKLSHVEDAIYTSGLGGPPEFDEALKREGFEMEPPSR